MCASRQGGPARADWSSHSRGPARRATPRHDPRSSSQAARSRSGRKPPQLDQPIRAEVFGIERLEQHAQSLAQAQRITAKPARGRNLLSRVRDNGSALRRPEPAPPNEPPPFTIVAEFTGTADFETRVAVTRLGRSALDQSGVLASLPDEQIQRGLTYAGYADTTALTPQLARELAIRGLIRTVVRGTVERFGERYIVQVQVMAADSGVAVARSRSDAESEDGLMSAVDEAVAALQHTLLRQGVRIRQQHLQRLVMTPSFAAYQKYAMAARTGDIDPEASTMLLREALALDPNFAHAWRTLGTHYQESDSGARFLEEALRHSDRLTEAERYVTEGLLAWVRDEDYPAAVNLFDRALLIDPAVPGALHNRCASLQNMGRYDETPQCYDRVEARSPFGRSAIRIRNHANSLLQAARLDDARRVAAQLTEPRRWQRYLALKLALAAADWWRAESLATTYLADPTARPWVPGRARLTLASVYAARGAIHRADSILSETTGAVHPLGVAISRSLLVAVTGLEVVPAREEIHDTLYTRFLWHLVRDLARGDTAGARAALRSLQAAGPPSHAKGAWRRWYGEHVRFAEALVAAQEGDWYRTAELARLELETWPGAEIRLFARWLLAAAYDRLERPDSAALYYQRATESTGLWEFEPFYFGIPYSFAHQRLVVLYSRMGRLEDARRHYKIFTETFTNPDPEVVHLLDEVREALRQGVARPHGATRGRARCTRRSSVRGAGRHDLWTASRPPRTRRAAD